MIAPLKLHNCGFSYTEIGNICGISRHTIGYHMRKAGVNGKEHKISKNDRDILQMYNSGLSTVIIANILKTNSEAVRSRLIFNNIPRKVKTKWIYKDRKGYLIIVAGPKKGLALHRSIMECSVGRRLNGNECVHHINGICDDNRIENLTVMSRSDHTSMHIKERNG